MHLWGRDIPCHSGGVENVSASSMQPHRERTSQLQDLEARIMRVNFERMQGASGDGSDTHKSAYYHYGFEYMVHGSRDPVIVDPFARNCPWGTITNDINEETSAQHHMDALDFMKTLESDSADYVLFDPPFSNTMAVRKYGEASNLYTVPGYVSNIFQEIGRVLKNGGCVLVLGYNSTKHSKLLELDKGWVVNFGGNRNDVIMTIWKKAQTTLEYWYSNAEIGWLVDE